MKEGMREFHVASKGNGALENEISPGTVKRYYNATRRLPRRESSRRQVIYQILDEGLVCHVGFARRWSAFRYSPLPSARVGVDLHSWLNLLAEYTIAPGWN